MNDDMRQWLAAPVIPRPLRLSLSTFQVRRASLSGPEISFLSSSTKAVPGHGARKGGQDKRHLTSHRNRCLRSPVMPCPRDPWYNESERVMPLEAEHRDVEPAYVAKKKPSFEPIPVEISGLK